MRKCTGNNTQEWGPDAIFDVKCHVCGNLVEILKDEITRNCSQCKNTVYNDRKDVIDKDFIDKCIESGLGSLSQIKKILFMDAKEKLKILIEDQNLTADSIEMLVTEGTPFLEINKKAIEKDVDIVIMGTHGTSGDMKKIFFGSTTERVLRFIKKPVLCVPIEEDRKEN